MTSVPTEMILLHIFAEQNDLLVHKHMPTRRSIYVPSIIYNDPCPKT